MSSPDAHPSLDELAALSADALEPADGDRLRAHADGCVTCRESLALLADTRHLLRAAPPATMPAETAQRLDAALAAEPPLPARAATSSVLPVGPRRRLRRPALATLAAAACVAALVSAIVVGAVHNGDDRSSTTAQERSAAPSGGGGSRTFVQTASGLDYTPATLPGAVDRLLGAPATAFGGDRATGGTAGGLTTERLAAAPPELQRLQGNAVALFDCVAELAGPDVKQPVPLAVDFARYDGHPAAVFVLPYKSGQVDVWVVGPGCSAHHAEVLYFRRLDRPAP